MSWRAIARKDFEDVIRSRMLWGILGVFVVLMTIITFAGAAGQSTNGSGEDILFLFANVGGQLLVPIIALVVGYMAIVGERQSGSLRMFFGLSFDRDDVFFGKLASRLGVIVVATLGTCALAGVVSLVLFGAVPLRAFLGFAAFTVLLGAMFTAIAVSVSAVAASRMQAMAGAIGSYVLFIMLWHPLVAGIYYALNGSLVSYAAPKWYFLALRLNPLSAYNRGVSVLIDQYVYGLFGWPNIVADIPPQQTQDGGLMVSERLGGELPVYLSEWATPVVLVLWMVVPVAVGYYRFERVDLN